MNDEETDRLLSEYLDGALPQAERAALEARLTASAELRRRLDDLRAVARAVKDLPRHPLPDGFMARFSAKRARGAAPRQDWVFLPPLLRPVALAASIGVVALAIWDRVVTPPEPVADRAPVTAKVVDAANAPVAQVDLSKEVTGAPALSAPAPAASVAMDSAADKLGGLQESAAPKKKTEGAFGGGAAAVRGQARGEPLGLAAGGAGTGGSAEPVLTDRTRQTMSEEERSARNEQMIAQLEQDKKKLGLKILSREEAAAAGGLLGRRAAAPAPVVAAAKPVLLKQAPAGGPAAAAAGPATAPVPATGEERLAPDAGLVFTDASSLNSSWILLGLPGQPPAVDFAENRAFLLKPSATKVLSADAGPNMVKVVFRSLGPDEASDPAKDRFVLIPLAPKTVLIFDASPR